MGNRGIEDLSPEERRVVETIRADLRELDAACRASGVKRPPRSKDEHARFTAAVDAAIAAGILDEDADRSALLWHGAPDDMKQIQRGRRAGTRRRLLNETVVASRDARATVERLVLAEADGDRAAAGRAAGAEKARAAKEKRAAGAVGSENERIVRDYIREGEGDRAIVRIMQQRGRRIGREKVAKIRGRMRRGGPA